MRLNNILRSIVLLMAIMLLGSSRYVFAQQNTGSSPYQDSWHSYRLAIALVANVQEWEITDGTTTYTIPQVWATYTAATTDGGYDVVQIYFDHTVFSVGTWYLRFRETDGNHNCVSAREYPINVVANTFYLTLAADGADCNSQDDETHTYAEVDEMTDVFTTSVTYTVSMTKNDDFDPTSWRFDANFEQSVTAVSAITTDGTVAVSELTAGTDYRFTITPSVANPSSVTVSVTVGYSNAVLADVTNDMTVTNGEALVSAPPAPDAVTDDNTITYVDGSPNRVQAITMWAVPSTRNIVQGAGETAVSAQNPLQNSTHRYAVQMGTTANYSNAETGWHIETTTGFVVLDVPTNYELVRPAAADVTSSGSDSATIAFHMSPGNYMLYYTEQNSNGCTTVRSFPITLGDPFDADLAAMSDQCSGADGVVFPNLQDSTTTVDYTVTLHTSGYGSIWYFTLDVTSNPAFNASDVTVSSTSVLPATVTYNSGTGLVTIPNGVETVTVRVVYNGLYIDPHLITVTISDVTGSFDEEDPDAIDSISHTLYAMPQAGTLAGID